MKKTLSILMGLNLIGASALLFLIYSVCPDVNRSNKNYAVISMDPFIAKKYLAWSHHCKNYGGKPRVVIKHGRQIYRCHDPL